MSFFTKSNKSCSNEINLKSIEKIRQSDEYKKNQKQIEIITNVLVEHADVPQELIYMLIHSVQENTYLEYNTSNFIKK